jgi:hypothetical protein
VSTYRHPDPAVREEMARILRSRPRYGRDSRRRERARQDAADHAVRVRRHLTMLIILTAAALFIIGWDHETSYNMKLNRPAESTGVTTTPAPHPATTGSHR